MEHQDGREEPNVVRLADHQKSFLEKLEIRAIDYLFSLIERPAGGRKFWVITTVGMFVVTAGPAVLIALYFFARDLGYLE